MRISLYSYFWAGIKTDIFRIIDIQKYKIE
jgi:hypothetical protein